MDRGIATRANLAWLRQEGYRHPVVSRDAIRVSGTGGESIRVVTASRQAVDVRGRGPAVPSRPRPREPPARARAVSAARGAEGAPAAFRRTVRAAQSLSATKEPT